MKHTSGIVIFIVIGLVLGYYLILGGSSSEPNLLVENDADTEDQSDIEVQIIADQLNVPWEIITLPDDTLLVTERDGYLVRIREGQLERTVIDSVAAAGEGGLLGITLHPEFETNGWLYLYETYQSSERLMNRVVRFNFNLETNNLSDSEVIIDNIPGASYHDGGRIKFGPDGHLYIATGDAGIEGNAQQLDSLAGKILRLTDDGSIPTDNPFGDEIYSYGHRNPQGLAWDSRGNLWSTEHGRSGARSGYDELNLIEPGGNYGWPIIQGPETTEGMISPVLQSGPDTTWAPASLTYKDGQLYWAGLRGQTLYVAQIAGNTVGELREYFVEEFGRLRTVSVNPDGNLYLTTSNRDGRGNPTEDDDRIFEIIGL